MEVRNDLTCEGCSFLKLGFIHELNHVFAVHPAASQALCARGSSAHQCKRVTEEGLFLRGEEKAKAGSWDRTYLGKGR